MLLADIQKTTPSAHAVAPLFERPAAAFTRAPPVETHQQHHEHGAGLTRRFILG
jgi:hypothetical protein